MTEPQKIGMPEAPVGSNDAQVKYIASKGKTNEVLGLLQSGKVSRDGQEEVMRISVEGGHTRTAVGMLKAGYDPHATGSGQNVWMQSVQKKNAEVIDALIEHPTAPAYSVVSSALRTAEDMPGNGVVAGKLKSWLDSHEEAHKFVRHTPVRGPADFARFAFA